MQDLRSIDMNLLVDLDALLATRSVTDAAPAYACSNASWSRSSASPSLRVRNRALRIRTSNRGSASRTNRAARSASGLDVLGAGIIVMSVSSVDIAPMYYRTGAGALSMSQSAKRVGNTVVAVAGQTLAREDVDARFRRRDCVVTVVVELDDDLRADEPGATDDDDLNAEPPVAAVAFALVRVRNETVEPRLAVTDGEPTLGSP